MLDFAGRGCPHNCLYLDTKSLTVIYDCRGTQKISGIRLFVNNKDEKHAYTSCHEYIDVPVLEHTLSIPRDHMRDMDVDIWVSLTNTHWREHSVIKVRPGNIDRSKKIVARYFSH